MARTRAEITAEIDRIFGGNPDVSSTIYKGGAFTKEAAKRSGITFNYFQRARKLRDELKADTKANRALRLKTAGAPKVVQESSFKRNPPGPRSPNNPALVLRKSAPKVAAVAKPATAAKPKQAALPKPAKPVTAAKPVSVKAPKPAAAPKGKITTAELQSLASKGDPYAKAWLTRIQKYGSSGTGKLKK